MKTRVVVLVLFILGFFALFIHYGCFSDLTANNNYVIPLRLRCQAAAWYMKGWYKDAKQIIPPYEPLNPVTVVNHGPPGYSYMLYGVQVDYDNTFPSLEVVDYEGNKYFFNLEIPKNYYYRTVNLKDPSLSAEQKDIRDLDTGDHPLDNYVQIIWTDTRSLKEIKDGLIKEKNSVHINGNPEITSINIYVE